MPPNNEDSTQPKSSSEQQQQSSLSPCAPPNQDSYFLMLQKLAGPSEEYDQERVQAELSPRGYEIGEFIGEWESGDARRATFRGKACIALIPHWEEVLSLELGVLKRVKHPHLLRILDIFVIDQSSYIFMEMAEGGSVIKLLRSKQTWLTEPQAAWYYLQVADAIRFLHSIGIAHLSVDLYRVFLDRTKQICKLTGFAIAEFANDPVTGQPIKCFTWKDQDNLPPEVGRPNWNGLTHTYTIYLKPVDVWRMGVFLFVLLNYPHLPNDEYLDLSEPQSNRMLQFANSSLSAGARRAIEAHFEPNPENRPSMELIMQNEPWLKMASFANVEH